MSKNVHHDCILTSAESRMLAQLAAADFRTENEEVRWLIQREWNRRKARSGTGSLVPEDDDLADGLDKGQVK